MFAGTAPQKQATIPVGTAYSTFLGSARLLVWATVCKTVAIALLVQFQPDLPTVEREPIRRLALFAKQMDAQLWFDSTPLRLSDYSFLPIVEGTAEWSATGLENQGGLWARGSIPLLSAKTGSW